MVWLYIAGYLIAGLILWYGWLKGIAATVVDTDDKRSRPLLGVLVVLLWPVWLAAIAIGDD